jgi:quinol monooxygenase YgiN
MTPISPNADTWVVRIAELEIEPQHLDAYRALLAEEIAASVAVEPGVLTLQAVAIKEAPAQIRILEIYANEAAYQAHLQTPHFLAYKRGTAAMVKSLRLVPVDPIRMASKALA